MQDASPTAPSPAMRVAIVGGGLSGLATAAQLRLANPDVEIGLFEAAPRLGGVIHTERCGDFLIDHGADMFATQPSAALDLVRRLGAEKRLILPQQEGRGARIVCKARLVDLPEGFVLMRATQWWPMVTTPLLSLRGKLRVLAEPFVSPLTSAEEGRDVSVAEFVRRRFGEEMLQAIVGPLVAGIYTADVERLSMEATMRPLAQMERTYGSLTKATLARKRQGEDGVERASSGARYEQFRAFAGGMIELIETLQGALEPASIRTSTPVESLRRQGEQWELTAHGKVETFDRVVVATPPKSAAALLAPVAPAASKNLASIESASAAIVVLALRKSDIRANIETFGFVVPPREKRKILAGSFASHKFAGRAPEDHVLVRVFVGGMVQPELLDLDDGQLVKLALGELTELIGYHGQPTLTRVVRWNSAMPQYVVGHRQRVAEIETAMEAVPDLHLVSNALHGVGIAPVIQAAGETAQRVLQ